MIERAQRPDRIPNLAWESCGAGCLRALVAPRQHVVGASGGFFAEGRGWLATISEASEPGDESYAIVPVDGAPVAAWRFLGIASGGTCRMAFGSVGQGRAGAVAYWSSPTSTDGEDRLFLAMTDALGSTEEPAATLDAPETGPWVNELAVGSEAVALHLSFGAGVVVYHAGALTQVATDAFHPRVWGDHVVWLDGTSETLSHWTPEAGTEVFVTAPDATISNVFIDEATLVWVRRFESGATVRSELWASPLARIPAALEPRLVHADAGEGNPRYGDGIYVSTDGLGVTFTARLIDIANGRVRNVPIPEAGAGCQYAHYVSSTEVLLDCGLEGTRVLYRIDPRTLPYEP